MKLSAFDRQFSARVATGTTTLGFASGSNSAEGDLAGGGDVIGTPGDYTVVGLRSVVSLGSNMGDNTVGSVLTTISSSPWIAKFALPSNSSVASNTLTRTGGAGHKATTIAASGAAQTLMVGGANRFLVTLTADCAIDFTGWAADHAEITVRVTEDGTGGWTPTFSGVTWVGGSTPTHDTTADTSTEYVFWTDDGGTTVIGGQVGAGGTTSPLTTKGDLYTFDTDDQRFAVGSNGMFVVADPTTPTGLRWTTNPAVGELLLSSTASKPPVFGDILTNSSEDDFVYGSR